MAASSRRSRGPVLPISSAFQRSILPSGQLCSGGGRAIPSTYSSSSPFDSYSSSLSSRSSTILGRPASPTRVNLLVGAGAPAPSVRFSIDHRHRPTSPGRHLAIEKKPIARAAPSGPRRTCMCSPTTHPGSFRCSLHKGLNAVSSPSNRLNARRSAMTNSLVRISTVEGEWVKRALAALIRPSSHQQKRRASFQPRPSRLSVMSKAEDL